MSFIVRLLTVFFIVTILKPALINSLPQKTLDSENTSLDPAQFNQGTSPVSTGPNQNFDINDDLELFDSTLATNTDTLDSTKNEPIPAKNSEETVALCPNGNGQRTGSLSGRDTRPMCQSHFTPGRVTNPPNMGLQEWFKNTFLAPKEGAENEQEPKKYPKLQNGNCPASWPIHLCGDGPESARGRWDIPGWPIHRTTVANLLPATPSLCLQTLFDVCCAIYQDTRMAMFGWMGVNCLILNGVDTPAPLEEEPDQGPTSPGPDGH